MRRIVRVPELVEDALRIGLINESEARQYIDNYEYFEDSLPISTALHHGKWVASLNGQLFVADSDAEIHQVIARHANWNRAYIRYMGVR